MILILFLCAQLPLEDLYQNGDYEGVVESAPLALAEPGITRSDSVRIYACYGSALVALGRRQEAAGVFRGLLSLDSEFTLNPERFSPKIRQVFDEVKEGLRSTPGPVTITRTDTVLIRPRPTAALLVPGLFQLQQRKPAKGYAFLGLGVLTASGFAVSHIAYTHAREAYLAAETPSEIADAYGTANAWHRARFSFGVAACGTWLYSLIDGLLGP